MPLNKETKLNKNKHNNNYKIEKQKLDVKE